MQTTEKPKTQSLRTRRFIARYVKYLEIFGYGFVFAVAAAIAFLWFTKTEDLVLSNAEPIKPHEYVLSSDEDVIVIEALVENKTDVTIGQPLFEISRDKSQVNRYRAKQVAEELSGELDSLAISSSLTLSERELQDVMRSATSAWEQELSQRETLNATHSGVILFEKEVVGTVVPKGDEIARILDFDDLRISAGLKGAAQRLARVGQPAQIELITTYGDGEILRTDLDSPDWWSTGFAQFNDISDGQVSKQLEEYFSGKLVAIEDDTVFALGKVKKIDLHSTLNVQNAEPLDPGEKIEAEPLNRIALTGTVIEGTHTAEFRIHTLPNEIQQEIQNTLQDRIVERQFDTGGLPLSVNEITDLSMIIEMDADEPENNEMVQNGQMVDAENSKRSFKGVIRIDDPHPDLKAKVRELALLKKPIYIKAIVKVVVGERRIAMLLFRKN